jgi:anti-sigma B factor antagonist
MAIQFGIEDRPLPEGDAYLVAVTGEVDIFTAPELEERVSAAVGAGASRLVVDLREATFIDSSSLGVLIGAHRRLEEQGGRVIVVCDNPAIVKTLKITGLDGVFTLVDTLDGALEDGAVGSGG